MSVKKIPTEEKVLRVAGAVERRSFSFKVRAAETADAEPTSPKLTGYAALFNVETNIFGDYYEKIAPGAFTKTISENDVRAVWNHNTDIVLGRTKNNTLELSEDEQGLGVVITPPDTDLVRDMCVSPIQRGDVDQMSFGFQIIRESWEEREDGTVLITLTEIMLFEVSPCTLPAYPDTEISARSKERIEEFQQRREAAAIQSAPGQTAHPEHSEDELATPEPADHPEISAPVEARHLDEHLNLNLDLAKRKLSRLAA